MISNLIQTKRDIEEFANLVALAVVKIQRPKDDLISSRQAFEEFDRRWIESRTKAGLLSTIRRSGAANSKRLYSRTECAALLEAERRDYTITIK